MNELASGQREAELAADLATLRADLERRHNQGRDRRRDESEQLTQLANHNQRLVEQLAEVSMSVNSAIMSRKGLFFFVKGMDIASYRDRHKAAEGVCLCLQCNKLKECS